MKKNIGLIAFFIILLVSLNFDSTNGLEKNAISFTNLNSNDFVSFVNEKAIANRISQICTTDFCEYVKGKNIEESLEIFKKNYEKFLQNNGYIDTARTTILKGFPITKVLVLD